MLIAELLFQIYNVAFHCSAELGAVRQPQRQALSNLTREGEHLQLAAELAMVALLRFFEKMQMLVQLGFLRKRCAVDTLQHLIFRIAAPVSTCYA
ncbi:hypothetical protein D3C78_848270 [compost metagenome]